MGGRGTGSGFRAGGSNPQTASSAPAAAPTAAASAPKPRGRATVLDFSAAEDHYNAAQRAPRQVQAYMDEVQNAAFSRPQMTASGDVVRTLTPDSGNAGIRTGLKARVITVFTQETNAFYRRELLDKDGIVLSTSDHRTQRSAEDDGRRAILLEMRRRGIY